MAAEANLFIFVFTENPLFGHMWTKWVTYSYSAVWVIKGVKYYLVVLICGKMHEMSENSCF